MMEFLLSVDKIMQGMETLDIMAISRNWSFFHGSNLLLVNLDTIFGFNISQEDQFGNYP